MGGGFSLFCVPLRAHFKRFIGLPFFNCVGRTLSIWLNDLGIKCPSKQAAYVGVGKVKWEETKANSNAAARPEDHYLHEGPSPFAIAYRWKYKILVLVLNWIAKPSCIMFSFLKPIVGSECIYNRRLNQRHLVWNTYIYIVVRVKS